MTCPLLPIAERVRDLLPVTGSEWLELSHHVAMRWPERWDCQRITAIRDWGYVLWSIDRAWQRHAHLERVARNLTPEQRDAVWSDASREAADIRRAGWV